MFTVTLRAALLLLIAISSFKVNGQWSESRALAECSAAVQNGVISQASALAIVQAGNYAQAGAFCSAISRLGSSSAHALGQAFADSFLPRFVPRGGDCTLSLAIATCSASGASNNGGRSLGLSDSLAIARGLGSQAVAVCTAMADSDSAKVQGAARSLLRACSDYNDINRFRPAVRSAFRDLTASHASAAADALATAGYDRAMAAAKACARAAGLSEADIRQISHASASSSASASNFNDGFGGINDASASSGSQASVSNIGVGLDHGILGGFPSGLNDASASAGSSASASSLDGFNDVSASAGSSASASSNDIGLPDPFLDRIDRPFDRLPGRRLPSISSHVGISAGVSSVSDRVNNFRNAYLNSRGRRGRGRIVHSINHW